MRSRLLQVGTFLLLVLSPLHAQEQQTAKVGLNAGIQGLSHTQAMLEFFYMEAGLYPKSLEELNLAFNDRLPPEAKRVEMPADPATGKPFVYVPDGDRRGYKLRFPDPSVYGLEADFEFTPVGWGWLALMAEQKQKSRKPPSLEEMALVSKLQIEQLAYQVELYAGDNERTFPEKLELLFPKYIRRHPQDPITGKNYEYEATADGYLIRSPNPEVYGLSKFEYSSLRGMVVEVLTSDK